MGKLGKISGILVALLLAVFLTGCISEQPAPLTEAPTDPPATESAEPPGISFKISTKSFAERYGEYYDSRRSYTATVDGIEFHFDVKIKEDQRLAIIEESLTLVSGITEAFPEYEAPLTLCFRPGDYPARFLDHTLYIGLDHLGTEEFAIGVAGAVFGHRVNYGLIFAHGYRIAEQMGYSLSSTAAPLEEALTLREDAAEYLDLSYPCFLEEYADEETLPKVIGLSLGFYDYLAEHSLLNLMTAYSDTAYCTHLSAFLAENGMDSYDNSDLQNTIFYFGGPKIRLVWETEDAAYYLEDDFETQYELPYLDDKMNTDYAALRQTVIDYSLQIDYMEEKLGKYEPDSSGRVDVLFEAGHATDRYSMANFNYSENLIRMFCAEPFAHEYGHYLLRETGIETWLNELICYYFGYIPVNEHISYLWDAEIARYQNLTGVEKDFISYLTDRLGHDVDWANPDDFVYVFAGYLGLYESYEVLTNPDAGAEAKVSFLHYLIGIAGEEAAIDAIAAQDPQTVFGKGWEELIADWTEETKNTYKWIHKYFYVSEGN